tara:strand:+ start:461 stop:985 length:525 start_codon:yes stop_codon:yes gene_type:complete
MTSIIKVNTIQDGGGNVLLTSNGSGTLTTNNIGGDNTPAFRAKSSGAQTIATGTETKLQFATEDFDTDSAYDNSTNYRFTPQVAGKYEIRASVRMATSTDYTGLKLILKKNGSAIIQHQTSAFHYETRVVCGIISFNGSSDYVEAFVVQNSGGNVDTDSENTYNFFEGYKLIGV